MSMKMKVLVFCLYFFLMPNVLEVATSEDECTASRCKKGSLAVRFPFRLSGRQPVHCGYPDPGFVLHCSENNDDTVLNLPFSVNLSVEEIDYINQVIHVYDSKDCLSKQLLNLNLTASTAFHFQETTNGDIKFFNCSSGRADEQMKPISCLSSPHYQVYASYFWSLSYTPVPSCRLIKTIKTDLHYDPILNSDILRLNWSQPLLCNNCKRAGKGCKLKNGSETLTECFDIPTASHKGFKKLLIIAGAILGLFIVVAVVIGAIHVWNIDKIEKANQVKVEKFLEDYNALKPSRYSYADIKRITNEFKDKIGQGGHGTVFKGNLSTDIFVAVKILDNSDGNGEDFITEVGTMGKIHHINVIRLVGFCAEGFKRALVYEYLANDSLEKFIFTSSGDRTNTLSWERLQDIALGVAKGIEYLHQGCDQRIVHLDIKPHNILLDQNFNPKISDFGLAKLCSKEQSIVSMSTARGTMGYIAPEVFSRNFGSVSYKSDVYSFGMVLLEMVGGRKDTNTRVQNTCQIYFPEWIYNRLEHGEEIGTDSTIARKLAIVGLWCIQWNPTDRPTMKVVVQMVEGNGESLSIPSNPFASSTNSVNMRVGKQLNTAVDLEPIFEIE